MKLSDIKDTWKEYGNLIKTMAAVVAVIFSGVATVSGLVITSIVKNTIKEDVGQVKVVTDLTKAVEVLTGSTKTLDGSVKRLDITVATLQGDVTDIHKHLAGID
jgi:predicted RNA-binding protein